MSTRMSSARHWKRIESAAGNSSNSSQGIGHSNGLVARHPQTNNCTIPAATRHVQRGNLDPERVDQSRVAHHAPISPPPSMAGSASPAIPKASNTIRSMYWRSSPVGASNQISRLAHSPRANRSSEPKPSSPPKTKPAVPTPIFSKLLSPSVVVSSGVIGRDDSSASGATVETDIPAYSANLPSVVRRGGMHLEGSCGTASKHALHDKSHRLVPAGARPLSPGIRGAAVQLIMTRRTRQLHRCVASSFGLRGSGLPWSLVGH